MRVLVYTHSFEPVVGGAEKFVLLLAAGLVERGYRVTVATPAPAGDFDDAALPYPVVRRPTLAALARLVRDADVVQLAGPTLAALGLALLARRPVVIEHHGYQAICPNGLLLQEPAKTACPGHFMAGRYRECLRCTRADGTAAASLRLVALTAVRRWLCRRAGANVAISGHVAARLALPRSRTVRYGLPAPGPSAAAAPAPAPARPVFAYVGRLVSEKGLPLLVEVAARLHAEGRDFALRFIGDGPERAALERLVRARGIDSRVEFTGFLRGAALAGALGEVTAVVMPSIWEETAGLAAIEHMQIGRLVVAADIGGLGEVVGDAGLRFAPGDAGALAERLRQIVDPGLDVAALGERARRRAAAEFSLDRMLDGYCAEYERLAGGASTGAG